MGKSASVNYVVGNKKLLNQKPTYPLKTKQKV